MQQPASTVRRRVVAVVAVAVALLVGASPAMAGGKSGSGTHLTTGTNGNGGGVGGAAFTTVNTSVDGTGNCQQGNPNNNCNTYDGKQYVWINGGPSGNQLFPDGQYFFVVTEPGGPGEKNPVDDATELNDQVPVDKTDKNLSDDYDTYKNRTFTVTNGEIAPSGYTGTHDFAYDDGQWKIRLLPYSNTKNEGGNYNVWICSLQDGYPAPMSDCKNDHFKVPGPDQTPPVCPTPNFFVGPNGLHQVTQEFTDSGMPTSQYGGIEDLDVWQWENISWTVSPFYAGTTHAIRVTGTVIDPSKPSGLQILVYDVAGNATKCDPRLATLRLGRHGLAHRVIRGLSRHDHKVTLRNRSGHRVVVRVKVNHHSRRVTVRAHRKRVLNVRHALKRKHNVIAFRGYGRHGAVDVMISN